MIKVENYFRETLERFVFIELEEGMTRGNQDIGFLKGVPIPVALDKISKQARESGNMEAIPFEAITKGMIFIVGVDEDFRYNKEYIRFLQMSSTNIVGYILNTGIKLAENQEYMDAAIHFKTVMAIEENNLDALYNYARATRDIFIESEDTKVKNVFREESVKILKQICALYPDFGASYYYLGYFHMNDKHYKEAKETWLEFLKYNEDESIAKEIAERLEQIEDLILYEKGYLNVLNEKNEEGLEILLPLYEKYKEWWNLLFFLGLAYRKLGEHEKAVPFFLQVVEIKPSQSDAMNELGICFAYLKEQEKAEKYLKKALLIEENDPEIICNLIALYIDWGKYEQAQQYLAMIDEVASNDEIATLWRDELERKVKKE